MPIPRTLRWQNEREVKKTETGAVHRSLAQAPQNHLHFRHLPTPTPSSDAPAPPRQPKPHRAKPKSKPCTLLIAARHERRPNARSRHGEVFGEKLPQVLCDDDAYEYELSRAVFSDAGEREEEEEEGEGEGERDDGEGEEEELSELEDVEDDDEEPGRLRPADEDVDMVESEDGLE
ncbi:hypothetical protein MVEN_01422200 [Mycena venus]|uniref:Uncharacterized protein n=1 Tax=Mycena venus TaxID=2733690 RepID=A0A8H6XZ24_9AGAR|nr:hypothetical protein MVEN_01422200 [Mycena venus]